MSSLLKLVVHVPVTHADAVREAIGNTGGGQIGEYSYCSFSSRGTGRFFAGKNTNPAIGVAGEFETVEEERIEITIQREHLAVIVAAARRVHPYEEPTFDIYPLETFDAA